MVIDGGIKAKEGSVEVRIIHGGGVFARSRKVGWVGCNQVDELGGLVVRFSEAERRFSMGGVAKLNSVVNNFSCLQSG